MFRWTDRPLGATTVKLFPGILSSPVLLTEGDGRNQVYEPSGRHGRQTFIVMDQIVNILGFGDHMVSVAIIHFCLGAPVRP